jgi:hypothetical protein
VIASNVQTQYNNTTDSYEPEVYGPYEIDDLDYEVPPLDDYTADDYVDWKPFPGKINNFYFSISYLIAKNSNIF